MQLNQPMTESAIMVQDDKISDNNCSELNIDTIVTHSETFHADEVLACAILQLIYGEIPIIRTRDIDLIKQHQNKKSSIVVDVGSIFNSNMNNYDHHQMEFKLTARDVDLHDTPIPLASSGLIWKYFGDKLTSNDEVHKVIYKRLLLGVDADDNGIPHNSDYSIATLSNIISIFNCRNKQDEQFTKVLNLVKNILETSITRITKQINDSNICRSVINNAVCDNHIYTLDTPIENTSAMTQFGNVLFVLPRNKEKTVWQIHTITDNMIPRIPIIKPDNFTLAPKEFIHKNKFIGIFSSQQRAKDVAMHSVRAWQKAKQRNNVINKLISVGALVGSIAIVYAVTR